MVDRSVMPSLQEPEYNTDKIQRPFGWCREKFLQKLIVLSIMSLSPTITLKEKLFFIMTKFKNKSNELLTS